MASVTIKQNKEARVILKLDHSAMEEFCQALSWIVDKYCVINEDKSISKVTCHEDVRLLLYEAILLDLYNRLITKVDCPLRDRYLPADKYSVKLTKAEALVYWTTINPMNMLKDGMPSLQSILNQLHKLLT